MDIVILAATRTPIGSFQGSLASVAAPRLGAAAIRGAIARAGLRPESVTDVVMGNVLQAGLGQAPARQAGIHAGVPASARAVTVHKVCGSGMQATMQAAHALALGVSSLAVTGGMENMSAAPYLLPKAREGYRLARIFSGQIFKCISDVLAAAFDFIVRSRRCSDAAEIKTQGDQPRINEAGSGTKNDLVVHRSAAERVRVANEPDTSGRALRLFQDRFQLPVRSRDHQVPFRIHNQTVDFKGVGD